MVNNFKMTDISHKFKNCSRCCKKPAAVKIKVSKMPKRYLCEKCLADFFEDISIVLRQE